MKPEHKKQEEKKPAITPAGVNSKRDNIKKNPNPRANENIPEGTDKETRATEGVGSEITDGEAG